MKVLWGPKELQTIDLYIDAALQTYDSRYFPLENKDLVSLPHLPFSALLRRDFPWEPDLILLTLPHQRILPQYFERSEKPLLLICQDEDVEHPNFLKSAPLFDGFIATTLSTQNYLQQHQLLTSQTLFCGIHPEFHFYDPTTPQLYEAIYINDNHMIPYFDLYESLQATSLSYFTKIEPSRLPNFISQSEIVIMDNPELLSIHFEVIGCGKVLLCHENNQTIQEYFEPSKDFIYFNENNLDVLLKELLASSQKRTALREHGLTKIKQYTYEQVLQRIFKELNTPALHQQAEQRISNTHFIEDSPEKIHYWTQIPHPLGLDKARKHIEKREPKSVDNLHTLTFIYIQSGRHEAISVSFEQMLKVSLTLLEPVDPPPLPILLNLGWIYLKAGQYEKVVNSINMSLTVLNNQSEFTSTPHLFFAQEDIFKSYKKELSELQALTMTLRYFLGEAYTKQGLFKQSIQNYQEILKHIHSEKTLHTLAKTYFSSGQIPEAIDTYDQLLLCNPINIQVLAEYIFQLNTHDKNKGLELCQKTLKWLPRFVTGKIAMEVFYYLERQLLKQGESSDDICRVFWEGPIFSHQSLANINRHLQLKMSQDPNFKSSALYSEPHEYEPDLPVLKTTNFSHPPDCFISHRWPPRFNAPQEGQWVNIIPWEFGIVPREWVTPLNTQLDRLWVPSQFVADSFIRSGVKAEQIKVIPNGVDTKIYHPEGSLLELKDARSFRFLFVGGTIQRKGIDILLEAYCQTFSAKDDVTLIIKGFGQKGIYSTFSNQNSIKDIMADPNLPDVLYLSDDFSDQEMASLYRSCHCYVHPYRGEGFGMPILEAMACGLPVIVPDAGPCLDFCDPEFAWFVPSLIQFESSRYVGGIGMAAYDPFWNEVDIRQLKKTMHQLFQNQDQLKLAGEQARKKALQYDWECIYQQISQELVALKARPHTKRQLQTTLNQILNQGVQCVQKREVNKGTTYFKQALEIDDSNITAWSNLSISSLLENKIKDSLFYLKQCMIYGLDLAAGINNLQHIQQSNLDAPFKPIELPLHIYWDRSYELLDPIPASHSYLKIYDTQNELTTLTVSTKPLHPSNQILRIVTCNNTIKNLDSYLEVWVADSSMKEELIVQGLAEDKIFHLPIGIDFKRYKPSMSPLILEESLDKYTFLSIFDWHLDDGWQTLLKAYINSFEPTDPVNLIFKPYGESLEVIVEHVSNWLAEEHIDEEAIPNITFVEEPLNHANLPGLYTGSDTFVGVNQRGNGIWHLVAQACGIRVLSHGKFSFLKNPYSQIIKPDDIEHLSWHLQKSTLQSNLNSKAIREYLEPIHHADYLQERISQRLGRRMMIDFIQNTLHKF